MRAKRSRSGAISFELVGTESCLEREHKIIYDGEHIRWYNQ